MCLYCIELYSIEEEDPVDSGKAGEYEGEDIETVPVKLQLILGRDEGQLWIGGRYGRFCWNRLGNLLRIIKSMHCVYRTSNKCFFTLNYQITRLYTVMVITIVLITDIPDDKEVNECQEDHQKAAKDPDLQGCY